MELLTKYYKQYTHPAPTLYRGIKYAVGLTKPGNTYHSSDDLCSWTGSEEIAARFAGPYDGGAILKVENERGLPIDRMVYTINGEDEDEWLLMGDFEFVSEESSPHHARVITVRRC